MQARYIPKSYALKLGVILVSGALLSACGGGDDNPAPADQNQNPTPTTPAAGTVSGTVSSGAVNATAGTPQQVTVAFKSSGSTATNLAIDRSSLPAEWTVTDPGTCASVTSTGGCTVTLTFTPTASTTSGSLPLKYTYTDSAGTAQKGTTTVPFTVGSTPTPAAGKVAYVTSANEANQTVTGSSIFACTISADGATLSGCAATGSTLPAGIPTSANVANGKVYVTNFGNSGGASAPNAVSVCTPDTAGALTCADAGATYTPSAGTIRPYNTAFNTNAAVDGGTDAYVLDGNGIFKCTVDATTGMMSACARDIGGFSFGTPSAMAINGNFAYVTNTASGAVQQCTINATGALTLCTASTPATGNVNGRDIKINNGKVYVVDQNAGKVFMYTADGTTGALSNGMDTGAAADGANTPLARPNAIAFNGTHAYITSRTNGSVTQCTVDATTGMLSACATTGATGPTNAFGIAVK
ncbi:MAG: hypothetical protein ACTHL1_04635 [Burkholderiaceae bacterium]